MPLSQQSWQRVSVHQVVADFLKAEQDTIPASLLVNVARTVITHPNTTDGVENHTRLRLLYSIRLLLMLEVPPDTEWFEVRSLMDENLGELRAIGHCDWDSPGDQNELTRVALRRPESLRNPPGDWSKPILWGHDRSGPFTILEGNKRLTGYVTEQRSGLSMPVYVGLSLTPCLWHRPDPPVMIANDWLAALFQDAQAYREAKTTGGE